METVTTRPGLREQIYLGGVNLNKAPTAFGVTWEVAETRQRARDGTLTVHRAAPYPMCAERLTKAKVVLTFEPTGDDIDALNDLIAWGGPTDLCLWRPVSESFGIAAGAIRTGLLQRRIAVDVLDEAFLPVNAAALYESRAVSSGVVISMNTSAPNADFRTLWGARDYAGAERIIIRYYPLLRVYVGEGQPSFTLHRQGQTLSLEER